MYQYSEPFQDEDCPPLSEPQKKIDNSIGARLRKNPQKMKPIFSSDELSNTTSELQTTTSISENELNKCKYILEKVKASHENRQSKIINVISSGAYMATPEPYFTSKHALMSFTKAFMKESDGYLRVYGICPGEIKTKMIVHGLFTLFSRFTKDKRKGHPDEIAELALLLCSSAGNSMKSNICVLDGGERILEQF